MAIIKTLLLQDLLRLGGRRLLLWTVLLVCGYIQCAQAALTGDAKLKVGTEVTSDALYKVPKDTESDLTCTYTGTQADVAKFRIYKAGATLPDWKDWSETTEADNKKKVSFNEAALGKYKCDIQDSETIPTEKSSPEIAVTWVCTTSGGECGNDKLYDCKSGDFYCLCKGPTDKSVFPEKCDACTPSNQAETCPADHEKCDESADPNVCKCDYGGIIPDCDECATNSSCTNEQKCKAGTPKKCVECINAHDCTGKTDMPNCVNDKCTAATPTSPVTGTKHDNTGSGTGQTEQTSKASVTSSAGTVTSTACLVIASVVVALMN